MLIFGHAGLTLGAAVVLANALPSTMLPASQPRESSPVRPPPLVRLSQLVDIRLLLAGSLLPDIIDKPLGQVFLRDIFHNGRIFSHTLLFVLLLAALGVYLYRRRGGTGTLALAFGSLMHILEDQMWFTPGTLLYPLYGFTFPPIDLTGWADSLLYALLHNPTVFVPEWLGLATLAWCAWQVTRAGNVRRFIMTGEGG